MANILIIAEHDGSTLNRSTARCVSCAATVERASIDIAVFASSATAIDAEAASLDGVNKIISVENTANEHALAAVLAPQIATLADGSKYVT